MTLKACLGLILLLVLEAAAQTLAPWVARSSGVTTRLNSVTHGQAGFVAVGSEGVGLRSADGIEWSRAAGLAGEVSAVACGNGIYFAVGYFGKVFRSADGLNWTALPPSTGIHWLCVAFDQDRFLVGGIFGSYITYDLAGNHSGLRQLPDYRASLRSIAPGWVMTGDLGAIFSSADATTWTRHSLTEGSSNLNAVRRTPAGWLALGDDLNRIYTGASPNALAPRLVWNSHDLNTAATGANLFVVLGDRGLTLTALSPEGPWAASQAGAATFRSVAFGAGTFIGVGDGGYIAEALPRAPDEFRFLVQPRPVDGTVGDSILFSTRVSSPEPIDFQWLRNGEPLPGAASMNLAIESASETDAGLYQLRAISGGGTLLSAEVRLRVYPRLQVTLRAPPGGPSFDAPGHRPIAEVIADQTVTNVTFYTGSTLINSDPLPPYEAISPLAYGEHLVYAVATSDLGLSRTSAPVVARGLARLQIDSLPPQHVLRGRTIRFQPALDRLSLGTYVWTRNGVPIPGATGPVLDYVADASANFQLTAWDESAGGQSPVFQLIVEEDSGFAARFRPVTGVAWPSGPIVNSANGRFYILGGAASARVSSGDGNWQSQAAFRNGPVDRVVAVAYGAGKYIAAMPAGALFESADGLNFTRATATLGSVTGLVFQDGEFLAFGGASIWRSADGVAWSPSVLTATIFGIAKANGIVVASAGNDLIFRSVNGGAFQAVYDEAGVPQTNWAVVYSGGRFLVVQDEYTSTGAIGVEFLSSVDGTGWRGSWDGRGQLFSASTGQLSRLVSAGDLLLIPASAGRLSFSFDGWNWNDAQLNATGNLTSVAHANGVFVVTTAFGAVLQTPAPASVRRSELIDGQLEIEIRAAVGSTVRIEESPSLAPGSWTLFSRTLWNTQDQVVRIPNSGAARFFRILAE